MFPAITGLLYLWYFSKGYPNYRTSNEAFACNKSVLVRIARVGVFALLCLKERPPLRVCTPR